MNAAAEVLAELRAVGIELHPSGDKLSLRGATAALTPDLRARVVAAKPDLLRMLAPATSTGLAVREVSGFRADFLADRASLAIPFALIVSHPRGAVPAHFAFARAASPIEFSAAEWLALVTAAESGRVTPHDFGRWAAARLRATTWRLTEREALDGARPVAARGWTVDRVLGVLAAKLVAVSIDGGRA